MTPIGYQILCIEKLDRDNKFERIAAVGVLGGSRFTLDEAIEKIEEGIPFFVQVKRGNLVSVKVVEEVGSKYLRTENDLELDNNLLSLPECE